MNNPASGPQPHSDFIRATYFCIIVRAPRTENEDKDAMLADRRKYLLPIRIVRRLKQGDK